MEFAWLRIEPGRNSRRVTFGGAGVRSHIENTGGALGAFQNSSDFAPERLGMRAGIGNAMEGGVFRNGHARRVRRDVHAHRRGNERERNEHGGVKGFDGSCHVPHMCRTARNFKATGGLFKTPRRIPGHRAGIPRVRGNRGRFKSPRSPWRSVREGTRGAAWSPTRLHLDPPAPGGGRPGTPARRSASDSRSGVVANP